MLAGQAAIAIDNAEMFENLQSSRDELQLAFNSTLAGWARALELRDREAEGETQRGADLAMRLAQMLGESENDLTNIYRGAILHDVGMMAVPDGILLKPGPLTDEEWTIVRRHPQISFDILSPVLFLRPALDIPHCHHEKWDGSGYPRRLPGRAHSARGEDLCGGGRLEFAPFRPAVPEGVDGCESGRIYPQPGGQAVRSGGCAGIFPADRRSIKSRRPVPSAHL